MALWGGYAVSLHGAVRGTIDVDIIINIDQKSFNKAEKILHSLGLTSKIPVEAAELYRNRHDYIQNKNLVAWSFSDVDNPGRLVDIIIVEDLKNYTTQDIVIKSQKVRVLAKPDLIRLKQKGTRQQDIEDVKALKKLLDKEEQ